MEYLNRERIEQIDFAGFQSRQPFPWLNIQGFLTEEGHRRLGETLPDITLFESEFGVKRAYGQESHDRYALQYHEGLDIAQAWKDFIAELQGETYWSFLRRMFGLPPGKRLPLTMHWHYARTGCSVSPHCDASRKLGSQIFYFNTEAEWDPRWGGQTLVLDDAGGFRPHSAPQFDEFRLVAAAEIMGNQSFVFKRTDHSWHGVRPLACPQGRFRKLFIVVINRQTLQVRLRRLRGKDPDGYPLAPSRGA